MSSFRIALCNEVVGRLPFERQCALASALGYDGLEIAPSTLSDNPASLTSAQRRAFRQAAEHEGIAITGLHWLLNVPEGLSLTSDDPQVRDRTRGHMEAMVDLCADLGGSVIVHGSPKQRLLTQASSPERARENAVGLLCHAAECASGAGVTYCIEPLSPATTDFVTNIEEALAIVAEIGLASFATMIDTLAAWGGESEEPDILVRRYLPSGHIRHIHLNDDNHRGPGQGERRFAPVLHALTELGYDGVIGIEPFDYHPDGPAAAARAIGYLRGILEAQETRP